MRREFFQFPLALVCLMVVLVTPPTVGAQQSGASDLGATSQQPTDPEEQFKLAQKYFNADGVPQVYAEALSWYLVAAVQEHAGAQHNLGKMFSEGRGVPQNHVEAASWFRKAAEQGFAMAQYNLGFGYFNGQGVAKDYAETVKWYHQAAEQGYSAAQYNLATMYTYGQGVPKDYVQALVWYSLAAEAGDADAARERDMLAGRMTGQQRAEAERLVVEWKQKSAQQ